MHFDTVQDVLIQCKEKTEALNLLERNLVLDHAIYAKAIEIIMDGNIGKGLKEIIVESGLFGENCTDQILRGG